MSVSDEFTPPNQGRGSLMVSVVVGVVVSLLFSFIPFSTVLGGVAAGFLRGGDQSDGSVAGALTGLVVFAPFVLLLYLILGFVAFVGAPSLFSTIAVVLIAGVGVYTVGGGVVGGLLGAVLSEEFNP
jgi:hypothetical protein